MEFKDAFGTLKFLASLSQCSFGSVSLIQILLQAGVAGRQVGYLRLQIGLANQ